MRESIWRRERLIALVYTCLGLDMRTLQFFISSTSSWSWPQNSMYSWWISTLACRCMRRSFAPISIRVTTEAHYLTTTMMTSTRHTRIVSMMVSLKSKNSPSEWMCT